MTAADAELLKWQHDEGICTPKTCEHCRRDRADGKYVALKLADNTVSYPGAERWIDPNGSRF